MDILEECAASIFRTGDTLNLKVEAAHDSETSVYFYQTIQHDILDDGQLHNFIIRNVNIIKMQILAFILAEQSCCTLFAYKNKILSSV